MKSRNSNSIVEQITEELSKTLPFIKSVDRKTRRNFLTRLGTIFYNISSCFVHFQAFKVNLDKTTYSTGKLLNKSPSKATEEQQETSKWDVRETFNRKVLNKYFKSKPLSKP